MKVDLPNPFRGVGQVAEGERFVVRPEPLAMLLAAWSGDRPGNVSLRGNWRVGKTSVVRHALGEFRTANPGQLTVMVRAGAISGGVDLLRTIAKRSYQASPLIDEVFLQACEQRLSGAMDSDVWFDVKESVSDLFEWFARHGVGALIVIDEFDRLARVCDSVHFQFLRDLASEPEYSVGLTTVSRRSVYEIETEGSIGSNLGGVLGHAQWIGLMEAAEASRIIARAEEAGVSLADYEQAILAACGTHPYLIDMVCYGCFAVRGFGAPVTVSDVLAANRDQITALYERYVADLRKDDVRLVAELFDSATAAAGWSMALEAASLVQRGLAVVDDSGAMAPFSDSFRDFLRRAQASTP